MARNKRKRRRRKGRFGLLFKALCFVALAGALVFGATVFFQVETVAVTGNARYKQEEIVAAAGIQTGDNLYRLNKNEIYRQVLQKLPYIESISIRRSLPSTIVIDVTEWDAVAQILPGAAGSASAARTAAQEDAAAQEEGDTSADPGASSGDSSGDKSGDKSKEKPSDSSKKADEKPEQKPATEAWLISVGGKLLEKAPGDSTAIRVSGLTALSPQAGTLMSVPEEEQYRLDALLKLLAALEELDMAQNVSAIEVDSTQVQLRYLDRFDVKLLMKDDFRYNLRVLEKGVEETDRRHGDQAAGTMDLTQEDYELVYSPG